MSDVVYASAAGIVQFDPKERDVNGQAVRDITIKAVGTQKLIRITVWPEYAGVELEKGFFVAVDGKFTSSLGQGKNGEQVEYYNISAGTLFVAPPATKAARETVQAGASGPTVASAAAPF